MQLTSAKVLSGKEFEELSHALNANEQKDFRNVTFISMLLYTGARVSEVLAISPKDLNFEGMRVFIKGLKNSNDRELPLTPYLFNRMKTLARDLEVERPIFGFGYNNARAIWGEYRPRKKKIHSLRHFRALEVYKKTKDILLVKHLLGHKSVNTTMIYLDYVQGAEEMRRALM